MLSTLTTPIRDNLAPPRLLLTLGDVAGIGPEVTARACLDPRVRAWCRPVVAGNPGILERALALVGASTQVAPLSSPADEFPSDQIGCWDALPRQPDPRQSHAEASSVESVSPGTYDSRAGGAAYRWIVAAAQAALAGQVDGIVTAPLNKASLALAGVREPGHTEILAKVCGTRQYAMILYVPPESGLPPEQQARSHHGLAVAHVTLHTSLASVPKQITRESVGEKISLLNGFLSRILPQRPHLGVSALNPHGGEGGLFGDEEARAISPAVERASANGIDVTGPIPADALIRRAMEGEFDGVVMMYHDQGHIPIKLVARDLAVNVTLGLPIVRTSPSHGTAFDIAWRGRANPEGMIEAVRMAASLCRSQSSKLNLPGEQPA